MIKITPLDAKKRIIELYLEFSRICKVNGFKHWVAFGTMLGTIRHGGFIPWDDDFDIFMPREDYNQFISLFKTKEAMRYGVLDWSNTKHYPYAIMRFNDFAFVTKEYGIKTDYGLGISIDVYPLDGINLNDFSLIKKIKRTKNLMDIRCETHYKKTKNAFLNVIKLPLWILLKLAPKKFFFKKINFLSSKYSMFHCEHCGDICWDTRFVFKSSWFDNTVWKKFENVSVPVPCGFDQFLNYVYGSYNQLPPEDKRIPYHFESTFLKEDYRDLLK